MEMFATSTPDEIGKSFEKNLPPFLPLFGIRVGPSFDNRNIRLHVGLQIVNTKKTVRFNFC